MRCTKAMQCTKIPGSATTGLQVRFRITVSNELRSYGSCQRLPSSSSGFVVADTGFHETLYLRFNWKGYTCMQIFDNFAHGRFLMHSLSETPSPQLHWRFFCVLTISVFDHFCRMQYSVESVHFCIFGQGLFYAALSCVLTISVERQYSVESASSDNQNYHYIHHMPHGVASCAWRWN